MKDSIETTILWFLFGYTVFRRHHEGHLVNPQLIRVADLLVGLEQDTDAEKARQQADALLLQAIRIAAPDESVRIINAYERIGKWYA